MTFVHPDTLIEIFDTIEEANQFAIYRKDSPRFVLKKIEVEDVVKTQYTIPLIQVYVDLRYKKILKGGIKKVYKDVSFKNNFKAESEFFCFGDHNDYYFYIDPSIPRKNYLKTCFNIFSERIDQKVEDFLSEFKSTVCYQSFKDYLDFELDMDKIEIYMYEKNNQDLKIQFLPLDFEYIIEDLKLCTFENWLKIKDQLSILEFIDLFLNRPYRKGYYQSNHYRLDELKKQILSIINS
jgi:hypothetical protein